MTKSQSNALSPTLIAQTMPFPCHSFHFPTAAYSADPIGEDPDPRVPLRNLHNARTRMDSLHLFLADSILNNAVIGKDQLDSVSAEISCAIHDIISSGAALISCSRKPGPETVKREPGNDEDSSEIVEVDAVELLAEHIHYCEICGKGFKRDANLRMHMRAHGNQFKTPEALAKPETTTDQSNNNNNTRFSCPYGGCNRNRAHAKFRALKSMACVKNHFKRSHCPKMFSCNRCRNKSFSVVADLRSHQKHCGEEARWRCTCGTSFSRKSKLFGHMALFEGHMPAVEDKGVVVSCSDSVDDDDVGFSDQWFSGLGSIEEFCLDDIFVDL